MRNLTSVWDGDKVFRRRAGSSIFPSYIITEFPKDFSRKIVSYNLGKIDFFASSSDVNLSRNQVIDRFKNSTLGSGGYEYSLISNVFIPPTILSREEDGYPVVSHGVINKNSTKENCAKSGFYCLPGEGNNTKCNAGKCVIGHLSKKSSFSWEYSSVNKYGQNQQPLKYTICGTKSIKLSNILRGTHEGVSIDSDASRYCEVYLPPIDYITEIKFTDEVVRDEKIFTEDKIDVFYQGHYKTSTSNLIGINSAKPLFVKKMMMGAYPSSSEGEINNLLRTEPSNILTEYIISKLQELPEAWIQQSRIIINNRKDESSNTSDFLFNLYDDLYEAYNSILVNAQSSIKKSKIIPAIQDVQRPIYDRLPGLLESYYKDPESTEEPIAKWLTAGADEFLIKSKNKISSFYYDFLDPDTCNPVHLDWLAQHIGLYGDLWDTTWEKEIKISIIKNAYGWWDRNSKEFYPGKGLINTMKGDALEKFPFQSEIWTDIEEEDNSRSICLYEPETINVLESDPTTIVEYFKYKEKVYNKSTGYFNLIPTNSLKFYKERWNGLMEAKGSFISIAFLSSIFGLKSHVPDELKILKATIKTRELPDGTIQKYLGDKVISPKSGLRSAETSAPVLFPYKSEMINVGDSDDAEIGHYSNQLVAGVSRVSSYEHSKNLFFRVPYYYNRDGRSWKKTEYIIKNWTPANINSRVQYAYLSADLWAVGDAFFEPDIQIKDI